MGRTGGTGGNASTGRRAPLAACAAFAAGGTLAVTAIERELREAEVGRGRKHSEEALRFLAESGAELSSSLDYRATLAGVARLAVPHLADWCAVDVLEEDGSTHDGDPSTIGWDDTTPVLRPAESWWHSELSCRATARGIACRSAAGAFAVSPQSR